MKLYAIFSRRARGNCLIRLTQYPPLVLAPAPALKPQVTSAPGQTKKNFCVMQTVVAKLG